MSINMCPTCGKMVDEDYDVEHYEICKAEQDEIQEETTSMEEKLEKLQENN